MRRDKEAAFQSAIVKTLRRLPYVQVFKTSDFYVRGLPDLIICAKGHFIAWELKARANAKHRPLQASTLEDIRECGGHAAFVYPSNFEEELKKLTSLMKGPPPGGETWNGRWEYYCKENLPPPCKKKTKLRGKADNYYGYFENIIRRMPGKIFRAKPRRLLVKGIPDVIFAYKGAFFAYRMSKMDNPIYEELLEAGALGRILPEYPLPLLPSDANALHEESYE